MCKIEDVNFVVVDVETTGPSAVKNRITEIGCVVVNNREVVDEYSTLINPHQLIPAFISKMTGITNEMVINAPEPDSALRYFSKMIALPNTVFVAHNVHFDWKFVKETFVRNELGNIDLDLLCTYKLARRLLPKEKKKNVGALADFFNIPVTNRHRALGDAKATAYILIELLERARHSHDINHLDDLLKFQNLKIKQKKLSGVKSRLREKLNGIPPYPGVYYFRNRKKEIIYVGKAKSLKSRVNGYFTDSMYIADKTSEMVRKAYDLDWKECDNELEALILESKEIKKHKPYYNAVQKKYRNYPFIKITKDKYPVVERAFSIEDDAEYYGPFRSKRLVSEIIRNIDKNFKLRKCNATVELACDNCFYYQIQRCCGPEAENVPPDVYKRELDKVRYFLTSYSGSIMNDFENRMLQKAEHMEYEEADRIKKHINELKVILGRQQNVSTALKDNNVILIRPDEEAQKMLEFYFIREGSLFDQFSIGRSAPLNSIFKTTHEAYFNGIPKKEQLSLEDIDEIKIINSWLYKQKENGKFIYIAGKSEEQVYTEIENSIRG